MNSSDANSILMIQGTLVGLGPLRQDLATTYQRWVNDLRVTRTLALPSKPMTLAAESAWLESASLGGEPHFTVYDLAAMRPIGTTGLHAVNHADGTAEFGIMIGEPDAWGRGFGTETTVLMRSYAFDVLGLHHLRLEVYAHNRGAIRAYERAGFQHVGTLREAKRIGRERVDVLVMDAIANDAEPGPLHALIAPGDVRHGGTE